MSRVDAVALWWPGRRGGGVVGVIVPLRVVACAAVGCVALALWLAGAGQAVASGWAIQAVPVLPGPTGSSGQLSAVSCASRSSCTAVGIYTDSAGVTLPLAERWTGARWRIQQTPLPAGEQGATLLGVACTSEIACTAVGFSTGPGDVRATLAERWNGRRWSIQRTPSPAGDTLPSLAGVACTSRSDCIAVGSYINTRYTSGALVERWNGAHWSTQRTPNPAGVVSTALFGVSCTSRIACTAVGNLYTQIEPVVQRTLAEHWNGSRWTVQRTSNPVRGASPSLSGVSCTSRTACIAVGAAGLAERWNGKRWMIRRAARPAGATNISLSGVWCVSSGGCTAVGTYTDRAGTQVALAESFDGTRWRIHHAPTTAGAKSTALVGVSCTSRNACTTVGSLTSSAGVQLTLAQRWNGTKWSVQRTRTPVFSAGSSDLAGVSCASPAACTAVGSYTIRAGATVALAERWDGTSWTIQQTPEPSGASSSSLNSVSCASPTVCTAVGSYTNSASVTMALAERWDGTSWTIQSPGGGALSGVSCRSATACVAVGGLRSEIWDGSRWTLHSTPNPTSYGAGQLNSVSCTSATACTAVGSYTDTSTTLGMVTLAERWDGSGWMIQTTPNYEPQYGETRLDGVSCSSATACAAVGDWGDSEHQTAPVAELWDGTNWTLQSVPTDGEAGVFDELNGVSCTSATACTAVGVLTQEAPLAETWNGTSWMMQTTPTAGGLRQFKFNGVSCTSATACTAVGTTNYLFGAQSTQLIEHES